MLLLLKVKRHIVRHRLHTTDNDTEMNGRASGNAPADPVVANDGELTHTHELESSTGEFAEEEVAFDDPMPTARPEDAISFEDIGQFLFGWWGRFLVDLCLLSSQLGFCVVYQIFLGDTIHGLLPSLPKIACLFLPVPILVAVCQIRRLKWLAATSFVALFVFGTGFVIALFFSINRSDFGKVPLDMGPSSINSFATLISFAVFSFEGIGLVLPLENSIRPDIVPLFSRLFSATVGVVTLTYTLVGAVGYVAWGRQVGSSLLDNVVATQGRSIWVLLVIAGFLIGGFCSYPLNMYPVTVRLETLLGLADANGNDATHVRAVMWKRTVLRSSLVALALALALAIPSFGLFIALIGALFSTALAFVFPTLFHMKLFSWPSNWPSGFLRLGYSRLRDTAPPQPDSTTTSSSTSSSSSTASSSSSPSLSIWDYASVIFDISVCLFGIVATIICTIVSIQNIAAAVQNGTITWSFQAKPSPPPPSS